VNWLVGAGLGLLAASGVLLAVRGTPAMRPIRLVDRMAPYLADTPPPSRLLARPAATSAPFTVVRRLFGPLLGEVVELLDRLVGGSASVRRRLNGLGARTTLDEFRLEQIVWGVLGMVLATLLTLAAGVLRGGVDPVFVGLLALGGLVFGVLGRD
jgi:tight adherence protein C